MVLTQSRVPLRFFFMRIYCKTHLFNVSFMDKQIKSLDLFYKICFCIWICAHMTIFFMPFALCVGCYLVGVVHFQSIQDGQNLGFCGQPPLVIALYFAVQKGEHVIHWYDDAEPNTYCAYHSM